MYTITLKEAKKRMVLLTTAFLVADMGLSEFRKEMKDLLDLTYKSGHHDGWYKHVDTMKK